MILATLALTAAVAAPARLTDRDRDIIRVVAARELEEAGARKPADRAYVKAWTITVDDASIRAYHTPKNDALPVDVEQFVHRPEYAAMLRRAQSRFDVGRISDAHVVTTVVPPLHCDRVNGGPAPGTPGYESAMDVTPPGYAPNGRSAMVYVHVEDCWSQAITVYRVVRERGAWRIADEWILDSVGE